MKNNISHSDLWDIITMHSKEINSIAGQISQLIFVKGKIAQVSFILLTGTVQKKAESSI